MIGEILWCHGDMIMRSVWYDKVSHQQGTNISYKLLTYSSLTYVYSHLVVTSKFPMLPSTTRKGVRRFCMYLGIKDILLTIIEYMQSICEE
jgi:hypothetical protein